MEDYIKVFDNYLGDLYFPSYDEIIAPAIKQNGVWEKEEFDILFKNIKTDDICLNVGAHVGYFATVMSSIVGKNGKVFAIEANPYFKDLLIKNTSSTKNENVTVISSAAGNMTGQIDLYVNIKNSGDNRVFDPNTVINPSKDEAMITKEKISVKIDKVDNLIKKTKIDFVLIDCQGYEHNIIRGMKNIILSSKPKIIAEFAPRFIKALGENPIAILEEYSALGYSIYLYEKDGCKKPVSARNVMLSLNNRDFTNLYLSPDGKNWN